MFRYRYRSTYTNTYTYRYKDKIQVYSSHRKEQVRTDSGTNTGTVTTRKLDARRLRICDEN